MYGQKTHGNLSIQLEEAIIIISTKKKAVRNFPVPNEKISCFGTKIEPNEVGTYSLKITYIYKKSDHNHIFKTWSNHNRNGIIGLRNT